MTVGREIGLCQTSTAPEWSDGPLFIFLPLSFDPRFFSIKINALILNIPSDFERTQNMELAGI